MAYSDPNAPFVARQVFTALTGQRIEINGSSSQNGIAFFTGAASELFPGIIRPTASGNILEVVYRSPEATGHAGVHAELSLQTLTDGTTIADTEATNVHITGGAFVHVITPDVTLGSSSLRGDLKIASDANGDATILNKDEVFHPTTDPNWPMANSWVDTAGARFAGYKDATGRVQLRGLMRNGTAAGIFTLPVGYRPPSNLDFVVQNKTTGGIASVGISTAGVVQISTNFVANTMQIYLDGISFLTF